MLSINIPVFNVEVKELVREISRQAQSAGIDYEIRVYDDCSKEEIKNRNKDLAGMTGIVYREMPLNLGRSGIRNKMGKDSKQPYLLFIDSDSQIDSDNFILKYIKNVMPGCVLCGGTKYTECKPEDPKKLLRWVYGTAREAIPATERNSKKGFIITSNNFLIDRQVFQQIHFRENIGPYGHEDTLLGYDLYSHDIIPLHIDNPVVHVGLEDSHTFLNKTRMALVNLQFIAEKIVNDELVFTERVRFLRQYYKLTRFIPPQLLRLFFNSFRNHLEKNLNGRQPNLLYFDLYKTGYFSLIKQTNLNQV